MAIFAFQEKLSLNERVLVDEQSQIIHGGISYQINIETRICEIEVLGVRAQNQHLGYGSILLSAAIFVGLQYGCSQFELLPRVEAIPFYLKHGFDNSMIGAGVNLQEYFEDAQYKHMMECHIYENEYSTKLTARMQKYNPAVNPVTLCDTQKNLMDTLETQFQDVIDEIRNSVFKEGWRQRLDDIYVQFLNLNKSLMIARELTEYAVPASELPDDIFNDPVATIFYAKTHQKQSKQKLNNQSTFFRERK